MTDKNTIDRAKLVRKWNWFLKMDGPTIKENYKKQSIAALMENLDASQGYRFTKALERVTEDAKRAGGSILSESITNVMGQSSSNPSSGNIDTYDPVLMHILRRALPNNIAYDVCGVQAMDRPTGLIFSLRTRYGSQTGPEALYQEANSAFSGTAYNAAAAAAVFGSPYSPSPVPGNTNFGGTAGTDFNFGTGMDTYAAELLGTTNEAEMQEMGFSIDQTTVTVKSRALAAGFTEELRQDLQRVHGLDAQAELANILSQEIVQEINREVIRKIYFNAKIGATNTVVPGVFNLDVDSNGRWSVEKFKGLMFQIEREANAIAKDTRRGKGNILITSSDVASALEAAGYLEYNPQMSNELSVDDTGNTFAGTIRGRMKVFIDPYYQSNGNEFAVVGYKGASAYDAGFFYCPYIPLEMFESRDPKTMQPRIAFKTRYGTVVNPFVRTDGAVTASSNYYYRRFSITNLS